MIFCASKCFIFKKSKTMSLPHCSFLILACSAQSMVFLTAPVDCNLDFLYGHYATLLAKYEYEAMKT